MSSAKLPKITCDFRNRIISVTEIKTIDQNEGFKTRHVLNMGTLFQSIQSGNVSLLLKRDLPSTLNGLTSFDSKPPDHLRSDFESDSSHKQPISHLPAQTAKPSSGEFCAHFYSELLYYTCQPPLWACID